MQPAIEIPLKTATDAGVVFRYSVKVSYPQTGGPIDHFPNELTVNWSVVSSPPGVKVPTPPGTKTIPPPTFTGTGQTVVPDLNVMGWSQLQQATSLPAGLCRAIGKARAERSFSGPADFKTRVDVALREIYVPARTYQWYEEDLIQRRSRFLLNGKPLTVADLRWP
jgi:hypothetical protein